MGFIFELVTVFVRQCLHTSPLWVANLFVITEFIYISLYYKKRIIHHPIIYNTFAIATTIFFIVYTIYRGVMDFNTFGSSFLFLIYIIYGIAGLYTLLVKQQDMFLEKSAFFWANVGFIVYASGSFLLLLFRYYLQEQDLKLFNTLWVIVMPLLNILKNIFFSVSFTKKREL
jgi:uncharacterized membrane protein YuzA (DUF378 family)